MIAKNPTSTMMATSTRSMQRAYKSRSASHDHEEPTSWALLRVVKGVIPVNAHRELLFLFGALLLSLAGACPAIGQTQHVLDVGPTRVVVEPWKRGVSVAVDGITVSGGSGMVITKPPWAPHYYLGPDTVAVSDAVRESITSGVRLRITHRCQDDTFIGEETITVTEDGRVERALEGRFNQDNAEALIQWRIAALNPTLIIGRPYRAQLAGGELHDGVVPVVAESHELAASTLAKGFEWIEFDSRIGPIRIEIESDHEIICYDFRKSRWANPDDPLFWLGDLGTRFRKGDTLHYRIVFQLPKESEAADATPPVRVRVPTTHRAHAQTYPIEVSPTIIPQPKEVTFTEDEFCVWPPPMASSSTEIWLVRPPDPQAELADAAIAELRRFLKERFAITGAPCAQSAARWSIRFELPLHASQSIRPEGYALSAGAEGVTIRAADAAGFLHGVQTLKQLATVKPDGDVVIHGATIRDWPSLRFRGIHMFTGGQGPELHVALLRNVIAALKMNRLVLESEYVEWDSHPEIHHPERGMPKSDVQRILETCDQLGIEVIPLVMSLGHCQWMFTNDQNLELAEDPEAKWAYCITNPKTYDFIFEIYAEALELFQPKWFHVGHDEFTHRGRYPYRESSKPYSAEQLLTMDVGLLHKWFDTRGVRMMMWGDMLLGKGEAPDACNAASVEAAAELRTQLPDDIIIADWHYAAAAPEAFTSLDTLRDAGHDTLAATWYRPENIVNYAKAAFDRGALGLLQTTWAGYSLDSESFQHGLHQYAAYVLAAEAAWNADHAPDPSEIPYEARFLDLMGLSSLRPANRTGWTADLRSAYNYSLAAADAGGWFGLGPDHDLSVVPAGNVRLGGIEFALGNPDDPSQASAVVLNAKLTRDLTLPFEVAIELNVHAAQLAILHATNFSCGSGERVGEYELEYDDGDRATTDVIYGESVLAYTDLTARPDAPIVWSGRTAANEPVALRVLIWENPRPEKLIRALTIRSTKAAGSLMMLGLTGLDTPTAHP
jgi:hexosaminidase